MKNSTRYQEIQHQIALLQREANELSKIAETEMQERYKKEFEGIQNKFFYGDGSTWDGYKGSLCIIQPISCISFNPYNSCKVLTHYVKLNNKKEATHILTSEESVRVDMISTGSHYQPLTAEIRSQFLSLMNKFSIKLSDELLEISL